MIYVTFATWIILLFFLGLAIYRLWERLLPCRLMQWLLLPGSIVAEVSYVFGAVLMGGDIKEIRLIPLGDTHDSHEVRSEIKHRFKFFGPMVATLMTLVGCLLGIMLVWKYLNEPLLKDFWLAGIQLPQSLPTNWNGFWGALTGQIEMLRRTSEEFTTIGAKNWQAWLFVYLSASLTIRMIPAKRDLRPALATVTSLAVVLAICTALFHTAPLDRNVWALTNYLWAVLLLILGATLILAMLVGLVRMLLDREPQPAPS